MATTIKKRESKDITAPERTRTGRTFVPAVDILETGAELLLVADVPGAKAEDIDIRYERGELLLHARVTPREPAQGANRLLAEYGVGDFQRVFTIGEGIDSDRIAADVRDGVLTLHLPKAESIKPRRIAVKSMN